ncbi:uncharacterized protein [Epargyreus clarus]|uniref:uncharacterized protein n=1 Tax=Epargyreus clarus TaxID=520877 RepID=UPI003C2EF90A
MEGSNCISTAQGAQKSPRKRKEQETSTSDSDTTSSESSSRGKSKAKRRRDRKYDKLFREINMLKNQINSSNSNNYPQQCCSYNDQCDYVDLNCSDDLIDEAGPSPTGKPVELTWTLGTKTQEPSIPAADPVYVQLSDIQRFNQEEWNNVRYADVQKLYVRSPGFTALQANDEIRRYDVSRSDATLEKAFAGTTYALLKQREALQAEFTTFLTWVNEQGASLSYNTIYDKINEIFTNGEYVKAYNDTLQIVCGHRAEIIQRRREATLASVKDIYHRSAFRKILPTINNLFDVDKFSALIEKFGGMKNVFWPNYKDRKTPAPQNDPSPSTSALHQHGNATSRPQSNRGNASRGSFKRNSFHSGKSSRGHHNYKSSKGPQSRSSLSHRDRGSRQRSQF